MKKYFLVVFLFLLQIGVVFADQKLPAPNMNDPLLKMLSNRKTTREFNPNKSITNKTLSDILWSAYGINRKDEKKRTIPTAMNFQDLEVYVIKKDGVFLYDASENKLKEVSKNNLFKYFSESQGFVENASVILLYTSKDYNKNYSAMHAGSAYQNVAVYCAEHDIANVVKGSMNKKGLSKELDIKEKNIIVAQAIGLK